VPFASTIAIACPLWQLLFALPKLLLLRLTLYWVLLIHRLFLHRRLVP
jgi:hypothetical protein